MRTEAKARKRRESEAPKGLAEALWPGARRRILGLLLSHPEREWHLREIARRAGVAPSAAQRELLSLAGAGILERRVEPGRTCYRANSACPIFPELRQVVLKSVGMADVLRAALMRLPGIQMAFVFGSMAKGTHDVHSDVDILIVADTPFAQIAAALHPAQECLGREITPTVYSPQEFTGKLAARHHFLTRVLEEPKIVLVGEADAIERLGQPTPRPPA